MIDLTDHSVRFVLSLAAYPGDRLPSLRCRQWGASNGCKKVVCGELE
jgi:hypothetical protein